MEPVIIDCWDDDWKTQLETVVLDGKEATLIHYDEGGLQFCIRLASSTKLKFEVGINGRTATFRKRVF